MSLITLLALSFMTLMVVVVLAACTSFPNRSADDTDPPDSGWTGMDHPSADEPVAKPARPGQTVHATGRRLKMHSWI